MEFEWSDARVLLAFARQGSPRGAAEVLGVNVTTVHRRVEALERALGCPLFLRGRAGWSLTAAGQRVLPRAEAMELGAASLARAAAAERLELRGLVKLSAPEALASDFLVPLLPALRARFPQIAIELSATNRLADLSRREADLALRLNRPSEGALLARRLARVSSALAASRDYLAARGRTWARGLEAHDLIWNGPARDESLEDRWRLAHARRARLVLRSESTHTRCAAAVAGLGITFLPRYLLVSRPALEALDLPQLPPRELWLVVHRESKREVPVRAVSEALAESIVSARAQLER